MPAGDGGDLWEELRSARRRVAELEALLPARTRDVNPPTAALRDALAAAGIGLWEWHVDSGTIRWSDGVERLFGLHPGEFDGRYETYLTLLTDEAREAVTSAIADAFAGGDDYEVEHEIVPRAGRSKWVVARGQVYRDQNGEPKSLVGLVADVSSRKEIQEQQRESEERFKAFATSSFEGIAFSIDGVAMDVNDNLCGLLGRPRTDILGEIVARFVHPEDLEHVLSKITTGSEESYRHRVIRKDGSIAHVEARGRQVVYRGQPMRMTCLRDVTDEVRLAEEHKKLAEQLLSAQKLEAVGRLAGGVAHDFNNIMMVMLGNLTMAVSDLEEGRVTDEVVEGLKDAIVSGKRAVDLISQLLAYSRKHPHCPRSVRMETHLHELAKILQPVLPDNVRLEFSLDSNLPAIFIDPGQLQQALMNLALNARDAMPNGGRLQLGCSRFQSTGPWQPPRAVAAPGTLIRVWVADEGEGIPPEIEQRIFEPFFTTKAPGKGTGLGLSTAYGVVKQAGGEILVESTPGAGTTFSLLLPTSQEEGTSPSSESSAARTIDSPGTVLVCEDNAAVRRFIVRVLKSAQFLVVESDRGSAAIEASAESSRLDLLITDLVLPDIEGMDLAEKIREAHPTCNVLLTSGYSDALKQRSGSAIEVLPKPFSGDDLLGKVKLLLGNAPPATGDSST